MAPRRGLNKKFEKSAQRNYEGNIAIFSLIKLCITMYIPEAKEIRLVRVNLNVNRFYFTHTNYNFILQYFTEFFNYWFKIAYILNPRSIKFEIVVYCSLRYFTV